MGLVFSHCDAYWSYGGFNDVRRKLAKEIGMNLDEMEGFDGDIPFERFNDDIIPLLNHSDCDGELTVDECKKVAPRLKEMVLSWEDDRDRRNALELVEGIELAISRNEPLEFK